MGGSVLTSPAGLSAEVADCLRDFGDLLADLVDCRAANLGSDAAIPALFGRYYQLQKRVQDDECSVAVLAAIKSGKSTLLNALLGELVLPSNSVPETARIVRLRHSPNRAAPLLAYCDASGTEVEVEGAAQVRERLRELNADARTGVGSPGGTGSSRSGTGGGGAAAEAPLLIEAPIAALAEAAAVGAGQVPQVPHPRISLLDTPGPNEAGQDHLRFKVERLLESVDAVMYVLDYTKLKSSDEAAMLQRLRELNPALIRRLCHRLFFVCNKMDEAEKAGSDGMDAEQTRAYVASLVTEQLGVPGFELRPEQVLLLAARDAMRARLILRGTADSEALELFSRDAFGKQWKKVATPELISETAQETLQCSGLQELEGRVLSFLGSRAALLHAVALADDLERLLAQVYNLTRASAASLHRGVAELAAQARALQDRLTDTLARFDGVGEEVRQLEGLVVDEVRDRMGRLRCRLEAHIAEALSPNRPPLAAPRGRWPAVWAKAKSLLGLGGDAGDSEQERLEMTLCELHSMVYEQVEAEVRDFWGSLEQSTNQRQRQLFAAINGRIAELSAEVEAEVSLTLSCSLEPVDMRLKPPTAEEFHVNLATLLNRGIHREVTVEEREAVRQAPVFVKRTRHASLCNMGAEWWEPVLEERTETVCVERVRYRADLDAIKAYFTQVVDESTTHSVRAVRSYVRAYLAQRLDEARSVLQAYAHQYTSAMLESLEIARQGEAERAAALEVAEGHCRAAAALLERVQDLQRQAEEMLDGWGGASSNDNDTDEEEEQQEFLADLPHSIPFADGTQAGDSAAQRSEEPPPAAAPVNTWSPLPSSDEDEAGLEGERTAWGAAYVPPPLSDSTCSDPPGLVASSSCSSEPPGLAQESVHSSDCATRCTSRAAEAAAAYRDAHLALAIGLDVRADDCPAAEVPLLQDSGSPEGSPKAGVGGTAAGSDSGVSKGSHGSHGSGEEEEEGWIVVSETDAGQEGAADATAGSTDDAAAGPVAAAVPAT